MQREEDGETLCPRAAAVFVFLPSLLLGMAEPAELLLVRDQYESAFHCLSRGLAAEGAGERAGALEYYRKGRQHLTQGVEVPTGGERHRGVAWDTARRLQQRMRDTLSTVNTHLSDLEASPSTAGGRGPQLLVNLPPDLYPNLAPDSQPPHRSLNHLYPTVPPIQNTATIPITLPPRPASPASPYRYNPPAEAPGTVAMAHPGDQPPAYTPKPTDGHHSLAYGAAAAAAAGLWSGTQTGAAAAAAAARRDGNELLFVPSGVQMFFVAPNGQVSSLYNPGFLRIITFDSESKDPPAGRPSAFLHVCDWLYPLTADTPVLLANSGIFMFPDSLAETPGSYVGIVLSSELPAAHREMFHDLLSQLSDLRIQGPEGAGSEVINLGMKVPLGPTEERLTVATGEKEKPLLPGWSEKMAQGILTGATRFSEGFVKGAEATGRAIHKGAAKMRDHITPEETPSEVSPGVTKSLQAAQQATGGAVRVSQFLVNGMSTVVGHVAEKVAPHVKKHGAKLVPESMKKSKDGQASNMDGAKFVAVSSVQGFSTVWSSLETGAKLVGKSVAAETVTTVTYKYGNDAGDATDTALHSVINVGVTAHNIDNLGIKAILKTAGKKTAKAMVKSKDGQSAETDGKEAQKKDEEEMKK
ncbi:spartin a isoform X1 [Scophthalmus maximus]|uniref:spartin a isoform X1 n=2 Tax=Scophthalmus maximus TaxID=52904 RepID=UPI001FA8CDE2|nr:spartin a isoform X1 [Scophthalmus maximus]XP_035481506.2 spartin a isoform X1 [Scophthalmus maximus]XP_035481507.2 spartin a isoform X1 [Scophthalmus maximus]